MTLSLPLEALMRISVRASWLALCLAAAAPAQTIHVVDPAGGGSFTEISQAIAAAQPGDIIVVHAGTYGPFTLQKGLRIVADPGVVMGSAPVAKIVIRDVPAGQSALLRGFVLSASGFPELLVLDNQGQVHLEDITTGAATSIQGSRQVSIHASSFAGVNALTVQSSTVSCTSCSMNGVSIPQLNSAGLVCAGATVLLGECTVVGADESPLGAAGPGIRMDDGSTLWIGGRSGGISAGSPDPVNPLPASAILAFSGTVHVDPSVSLTANGGAPAISGGALVRVHTVPAVDGDVLEGVLTATAEAPAGSTSYLVFGFPLAPPVPLPFGNLWISVLHVVLDASVVAPSGVQTATVPLPPLTPGFSVLLQTVVVDGGGLSLSNPAILTIDA